MNLFQRIKTSLSADAHGLVDAMEDDALLLRQHLRDAEAEVLRKRARCRELEGEQKRSAAQRERAEIERERAEHDVDLALEGGRDELARYAMKQLLTRKALIEQIEARLASSRDQLKELEAALAIQEVALEDLRGKVQAFLSEGEKGCVAAVSAPISDEQIEIELLRRKSTAQGTRAVEVGGKEEGP